MSYNVRKILAIVFIIIIAFGWVVTVKGIGPMTPIKDRMNLGLDIKGGVYVVLEADKKELTKYRTDEDKRTVMEQTQAVIERRVNELGLSEPTVTIEGENRIRVELPGATNAEEAIEQIGKTAQLIFILADGTEVLNGSHVKDAQAGQDDKSTSYAVNLQFDSEGTKAFGDATTKAYNGEVKSAIEGVGDGAIAIILDNQIISAPNVNEPILGGSCKITGDFSQEKAQNLAALIRGGSLPITLTEVTSSVQSAKIGYNALEMSVYAGLIGLGLILLLMLFAYRGLGIAADLALLFYVVIVVNIMSLMGMTLTLPGIAGMIVAVGMAVDANVIIFSRIREELAAGRSIRVAAETGYRRALTSVIDSQVTTLIAAVILYEVGTSSVKGFAFTFMVGIIVSIFTAVIVTQLYVGLFAQSRSTAKMAFFCMKKDGSASFTFTKLIHIIDKRKVFYCISIIILATGLMFGLVRGLNFGIDFTGGTMIQMDMGKQVKISDVKDCIKEYKLDPEIIYSGEGNQEIVIRTTKALENEDRAKVIDTINEQFGTTDENVIAQELFGGSIGKELRNNALLALAIAALCMLVYIRIRFRQWRFGAAALLGDLHDVLIVVSFYAIFQVTVNNPFIAGILTVVGYSINDTIVIFDRIRENLKYMKRGTLVETIDRSLTQTLGRSLMTSATTILVMVPMLIMAGDAIREFVMPLMVGILAGTYSSICMCSPLYYEFSTMDKVSKYERQVKLAKKQAKKETGEQKKLRLAAVEKAGDEAKAIPAGEGPGVDQAVAEADSAKAAQAMKDTGAKPAQTAKAADAKTAEENAAEQSAPKKADRKPKNRNNGQRRSKRYVKGNRKTVKIREEDETFRL
ncbi:MAG: protein translocase subunit SecD [Bacillota bacterium]|nr:protein translocase subunit SecD [Bacillota bacterium]